ncbi:MAG: MBL fold metallo-hydrolase [Desulfohalobiaceae bacterium]|nr:MBL fold metallo-hydrolase [Desulfohalobiaceae bacterium]
MADRGKREPTLGVREIDGVEAAGAKVRMLGTSLPVYAYSTDGLLIDTGPTRLEQVFMPFFRDRRIDRLAVTHVHEDHCGQAAALQAEKGVTACVPRGAEERALRRARLPLYRRIFWGPRPAFAPEAFPDRIETERHTFEVVRAPGHTRDHVCLFESSRRWLFSGDVYTRSQPSLIFGEEDVPELVRTLNRLLELDVGTLFCAHAGVVEDGWRALATKRDYLLRIGEQVRHYRKLGYSLKRIDRVLFPKKPAMTRISLGEWSSLNLVRGAASLSEVGDQRSEIGIQYRK